MAFLGSLPGHGSGPGLPLGQMQAVLGSDGPARDHQALVRTGQGEGMEALPIPAHLQGAGETVRRNQATC
jgi:hypothetical protein